MKGRVYDHLSLRKSLSALEDVDDSEEVEELLALLIMAQSSLQWNWDTEMSPELRRLPRICAEWMVMMVTV